MHTRFGTHGELLHRMARGLNPQPISRRQVPPEFEATLMLEPPLDLAEQIAFSVRTTAEKFVTDLAGHGLVCTTVLIEVDTDGVAGDVPAVDASALVRADRPGRPGPLAASRWTVRSGHRSMPYA